MARNKPLGKKLKLISRSKRKSAPRWCDIKKFGLKRARSRRIQVGGTRNWRRSRQKV